MRIKNVCELRIIKCYVSIYIPKKMSRVSRDKILWHIVRTTYRQDDISSGRHIVRTTYQPTRLHNIWTMWISWHKNNRYYHTAAWDDHFHAVSELVVSHCYISTTQASAKHYTNCIVEPQIFYRSDGSLTFLQFDHAPLYSWQQSLFQIYLLFMCIQGRI